MDWAKPLVLGLAATFVLGGVSVWANDSQQNGRIARVEKKAMNHDDQIQGLRESRIRMEGDIRRIKQDTDKILRAIERLEKK